MLNFQIPGIRSLFEMSDAINSDIEKAEKVPYAFLFLAEENEKFYTPYSVDGLAVASKTVSHTESGFKYYSPYYGNIEEKMLIRHPLLGKVPAVRISNPVFDLTIPSEKIDIDSYSGDEIIEAAKKYGIIDETDGERLYKKLLRIRSSNPQILVCNALSDMPYEAAKTGLLRQYGNQIAKALVAAACAVGAGRCCFAVFEGKGSPEYPSAINSVPVMKINFRYPSKPLLDMQIRGWGGGDEIGAAALFALYVALCCKVPHTFTVVTVDGNAVKSPKNIMAPIGAPIGEIAKMCGLSDMPHTFIIGGIMTGKQCLPETPICPTVTSIIVNDVEKYDSPSECVGCSECVGVCPKRILPVHIMKAYGERNLSLLRALNPELCIGCGCCSFVCPSRINIMDYVKSSKELVTKGEDNEIL
ncbi:MAG: 4Fe-4S dicluster domain-containing protein [Acutalibacteraceae bacterium]